MSLLLRKTKAEADVGKLFAKMDIQEFTGSDAGHVTMQTLNDGDLTIFWNNIETAAALTLMQTVGYAKGFEHGRTLQEFCEPNPSDQTYFPLDMRFWKGTKCE